MPKSHQPRVVIMSIGEILLGCQNRRLLSRLHVFRTCRGYASSTISAAELKFGQPLHETHPHILGPGECKFSFGYIYICGGVELTLWDQVTPGITALEYAHRRSRLANRLPQNSIAVLAAAEVQYRASGIFYEYRQDTNFFYLTGTIMVLGYTV